MDGKENNSSVLEQQGESILCNLMDDHASEEECSVVLWPHAQGYSSDLNESKQEKKAPQKEMAEI